MKKAEFSPDGTYVVSLLEDGTVILWDAEGGDRLLTLSGQPYWDVAFSPEGTSLATVANDGRAILWDVRVGEQSETLVDENVSICAIAFSPDGSLMAIGTTEIMLIDMSSRDRIKTLKTPGSGYAVSSLAFSPDGSVLAAMNNRITLWDWSNGKQLHIFDDIDDRDVNKMAFSSDGRSFAIGTHSGAIHLWDIKKRQWLHDPMEYETENEVSGLAFSANGAALYAAYVGSYQSANKPLIVWDVISGQERRILENPLCRRR